MHALRGGRQPDVAALTGVLAGHDERLSEALLFAVSGGVGAGYALQEFPREVNSVLALGFRSGWQRPRAWVKSTVDRLGLAAELHTASGRRGASKRLSAELAAGHPVLVTADRQTLGHVRGGVHFVVAYGEEDGRVLVDDRNLEPLTVARKAFDLGRHRGENLLVRIEAGEVKDLERGVREGLADCAGRMSGDATWAQWAKSMTDPGPTGWPTVFASRRGLVSALLTVWESVTPGVAGGHLRDLFADALVEAGALLEMPSLAEQSEQWRAVAAQWDEVAEAALPNDVTEFAWMRALTQAVSDGVRGGDAGVAAAADAGERLRELRGHYDGEIPFTDEQVSDLFADLGERLAAIHTAETSAASALAAVLD